MNEQDCFDDMTNELASLQRWIRIAHQHKLNCPSLAFALASVAGWLRDYGRGIATFDGWLAARSTANQAVEDYLALEWKQKTQDPQWQTDTHTAGQEALALLYHVGVLHEHEAN